MLEASVVAMVAVREHRDHEQAVERATQLLAVYRGDLERAEAGEWGVLLLHAAEPAAGAERALAREQVVSSGYAAYQCALNDHLHALADTGRFAQTIVVGDRAILDVQHELRELLRDRLGLNIPGISLRRVEVVALGASSESGTSTAGAYLAAQHGHTRLKIGYLLESAAARYDIADVYALEEAGIAEMMVLGLEAFCSAHHFQRHVLIESLRGTG